ncbi:MAG: transcription antitermination factor NusB [Spirosomaceae bacterium]|nr:transcription antitermination factor NusB [Spirosomataceae bacterium]
MLNRRLIRIRAMQALFAYKQAEGANFQLGMDLIAETFAPDLNSMEYQDREKLEGYRKLSQQIFTETISKTAKKDDFDPPREVKNAVDKARDMYLMRNRKDAEHYANRSIAEAEKVYDLYLLILALYIEVADRAKLDDTDSKLVDNQVVKAIRHDRNFELQQIRRNANWKNEQVLIAKFYREAVKKNPYYTEYCSKKNHTLDEDVAILKYLLKNVILKHEITMEYFDRENMYLVDDIETLRAMVTHTIQSIVETGKIKVELLEEDWEQSKEFLQTLYRKTIYDNNELEEYLVPKLKNWDYERIAIMDKILMMMGLTELINFPSIPIKVTINEIIEIAKDYSTPKSGQFINGVLDSLSKELKDKGIIRKTGRGMLDNK